MIRINPRTRCCRTRQTSVRSYLALIAGFLLAGPCLQGAAQPPASPAANKLDFMTAGGRIPVDPVDRRIAAVLRKVSAAPIQADVEKMISFNNRSTVSSTETDLPAGSGVLAASGWIQEQFEKISQTCGNCLDVKVDDFVEQPPTGAAAARARIVKPTRIRNIYAILRGSDPVQSKRLYMVMGHYDTRVADVMDTHSFAPGANDDSSGAAVSLEAARVLSQQRFPATIVFACVAGEEQGLNGSHHLAQLAKEDGWQLEGVLNNDIVGGDSTAGDTLQNKSLVRVFSQGILPTAPPSVISQMLSLGLENDSASRELAREILSVGRTYFTQSKGAAGVTSLPPLKTLQPVMELRLDRYLRGGDHSSFNAEGFPAVRFTEWRENFNHQHQSVRTENGIDYGDLLKFVDFEYVAQVARLNIATLATLASSPGMPQNVRVVTSNLDNDTTLKWDPPSAPASSAQYQIVWRETASPDWEFSTDAARYAVEGAKTVATVPVSKDNVIFGVRACDAAGHCSQAVVPLPEHRP